MRSVWARRGLKPLLFLLVAFIVASLTGPLAAEPVTQAAAESDPLTATDEGYPVVDAGRRPAMPILGGSRVRWTGTTHVDGPPGVQGTFTVYTAFGEATGLQGNANRLGQQQTARRPWGWGTAE